MGKNAHYNYNYIASFAEVDKGQTFVIESFL